MLNISPIHSQLRPQLGCPLESFLVIISGTMSDTLIQAFNAYGTKYIVHITSQQNSASNFTIGSNKIEKIEDAFQVNRLLCSCLEGMRSMFVPKTNLEMTLLRNVGNFLRKRFIHFFCWKYRQVPRYHCTTVIRSRNWKIFSRQEKSEDAVFVLGALRLNGAFLDEYTSEELPLHYFPSLVS